MKMPLLRAAALLAALALMGCSREAQPEMIDETRLGETTDVDVAAWLKLPRRDLAKLADEWADAVRHDLDAARQKGDAVELLPNLYPPVRVPVFREATFSAVAGFSLPRYVKPGSPDAAVALHLARHGDIEAALKLAGDAELHPRIEAERGETNYPVEWTRLVGLVMSSSQLKLASGNVDAATRLVRVHEQLRKVLDRKARAGALGSALLPSGKRALMLAARAWREPGAKKPALADDIDKALAEWGGVPGPAPGLAPGSTKETLAGVLGRAVPGRAVVLQTPEEMSRPLDLMSVPAPTEALSVVGVFLDKADRVAEIQLTYRAKIEDVLPEPIHLAFHLDEMGLPMKKESRNTSLHTQTFVSGTTAFEAARTNRSNALGGWVRLVAVGPAEQAVALHGMRVVGPVDLGRGFEANRVALDPAAAGPSAVVKNKTALEKLTTGLALPVPVEAVLTREKEHDLLASLQLVWGVDQNTRALTDLLPALWRTFGDALGVPQETGGAYLGYTWKYGDTRLELRLPFDEKGPMLLVEDVSGKEKLAARAEEVHKRDAAERQARLEAGKPDARLLRSPGAINNISSLEGLHLGQPKSEAMAVLPGSGANYRRKNLPDLTNVVVLTNPFKSSPYWARQIQVRYLDDKVAEIRVRYQEGLAKVKASETLLAQLGEGKAGAAEDVEPTWKGLWSDLPRSRARTVQVRWMDDLTVRTYQKDAGGSEVVWTDRAASDRLKPLAWVQSGVPGCKLGDTRATVRKALNEQVASSRGAEVYRQPSSSPYEMVLVWFTDGKASRILAVHRARPGTDEKAALQALNQAWGSAINDLGFLRRQEEERGSVLAAYHWHDDVTRVDMFVQTTEQGPRLMTEFRAWSAGKDGPASPVTADIKKGKTPQG